MIYQLTAHIRSPFDYVENTWLGKEIVTSHLSCSFANGFSPLIRDIHNLNISIYSLFGALEVCRPGHIVRFGMCEHYVLLLVSGRRATVKEKIGKMWKKNLPDAPAAGRSILGESVGKMRFGNWSSSVYPCPQTKSSYTPQQHVYPNLKAAVPKAVRAHRDVITLGEDEFAWVPL